MAHFSFIPSVTWTIRSSTLPSSQHGKRMQLASPLRRPRVRLWTMSSVPEPERSGSSADDDALNMELQKKVDELFGGRQNVSIDMETDAGVQFSVRRKELEADYRNKKAAWTVITSITVLSVFAGILVVALVYSGAVHGSDQTHRRYEMPSYGNDSYIDPYELLDKERVLQEAESVQPQ